MMKCDYHRTGTKADRVICAIQIAPADYPEQVCRYCPARVVGGIEAGRLETAPAGWNPEMPALAISLGKRRAERRRTQQAAKKVEPICTWRGEHTGLVRCASCGGGGVSIKVFECGKHDRCTMAMSANGIACCRICKDYEGASD